MGSNRKSRDRKNPCSEVRYAQPEVAQYPLVRPFDRKLATGNAFPRFFLSSSTKCWLGVFSTTSASYNLIIFYELALLLVICPFPAILFSYIIVCIYIYIYMLCSTPRVSESNNLLRTSPFTGYLPLSRHFHILLTDFVCLYTYEF